MNEADVREGFEIVRIEREQMRDAMRQHHRRETGVVRAAAFDVVLRNEREPMLQHIWRIRQMHKLFEEVLNFCGGLLRCPSISVDIRRTCHHRLKFNEILRRDAE